jgi:protein SCO1/2
MNRWRYLLLAIVALLILAACAPAAVQTAALPTATPEPAASATPDRYVGDLVAPPVQLQDFTMPASTGNTLRLSDLNGRWRLMFFGYLHCPDFCPLTLTEYRQVKQLLGADATQVAFVYISVDGVRDTPQALRDYLDNFDAEFIGFSGDDETLARIQPDYGFYYRRQLNTGSQAAYIIDHSTRSYLVDPEGYLRATFTYDIAPSAIAAAIQWHMAGAS